MFNKKLKQEIKTLYREVARLREDIEYNGRVTISGRTAFHAENIRDVVEELREKVEELVPQVKALKKENEKLKGLLNEVIDYVYKEQK